MASSKSVKTLKLRVEDGEGEEAGCLCLQHNVQVEWERQHTERFPVHALPSPSAQLACFVKQVLNDKGIWGVKSWLEWGQ